MQSHHHHHHHHHLQQQLAALLSAALPQTSASAATAGGEVADSTPSSSQTVPEGLGEKGGDESRVGALESLQRIILYPPNALVISLSSPFLSQGLFQLLSDKSSAVRRAAAIAYGSLCAILVSTSSGSNGAQNHSVGLADRFMAWALPLLGNIRVGNGSAELALESLLEFLNAGDANSIERFVPLILKACQELLEDDRTSLTLLHQLLGVLTLISLKFSRCFQPHFADIVDLLLGWAFMPDLSESGRTIIMDSFLQFQKHWLSNLQFSLRLLSKFLGDIEVLIQDTSLEAGRQFGRLLALFTCFSTVLQVIASGMTEMDVLEEVRESLENMAPRFMRCILSFGRKFGSSKWMRESWRCLILLAEILEERFSNAYPIAIDIFFQSLSGISSLQVNALVKSNLQLLSKQKMALHPSSVKTALRFYSPLSQLRLHPNHLVVASSSATYLFFLQHGSDAVVSEAIAFLIEELEFLKTMLGKFHGSNECLVHFVTDDQLEQELDDQLEQELGSGKSYSEHELISLIKFDLSTLLSSVFHGASASFPHQVVTDTYRYERSMRLASSILEKLHPFEFPIKHCFELQLHIVKTLKRLSEVEFLSKLSIMRASWENDTGDSDGKSQRRLQFNNNLIIEYRRKYNTCIVMALDIHLPVSIKLEALDWIKSFGCLVTAMERDKDLMIPQCVSHVDVGIGSDLLVAILDASFMRESKVRACVASVLEVLFLARLIDHTYFHFISKVLLDKLGDPDVPVKNDFARVLSLVLPLTIYSCGVNGGSICKFVPKSMFKSYDLSWKNVLALKQCPRKLYSHQFVSIMSYISQRSKVPLSSWIQRLVFSCPYKQDPLSVREEIYQELGDGGTLEDCLLDKICPVNNIAAVWWSIHEAARHCIALRLRTNLGGPTQTFAALERVLLDIPNVLLLDAEQGDNNYIASSYAHLLPMRLLLDFVEALKKNVYNAYEGSFNLPLCSRQSSLFFRANKKVCEEWFSRICEPMMNAGLALHCHDATIQYCLLRLQDLRNLAASSFKEKARGASVSENIHTRGRIAGDVMKVVRYASLALCRNFEPEALIGLQKWVITQFSALFKEDKHGGQGAFANFGHFSWITGLVHQAQGQYEKAAAYFSHMLQSEVALTLMGSDGVQFIIARVIECYSSVSDWNSLESWFAELQSLRAMHAGKAYSGALTAAGNDVNAVHALARYDLGDFQAAWSYLDLTPKSSCEVAVDPKVSLERSEQMLLRSMLKGVGSFHDVRAELEKAKLMLDEAFSVVPLDGLPHAVTCAIQLHCIHAFEEGTRSNNQDQDRKYASFLESFNQVMFSPMSKIFQDCSSWIKVFRVYRTVMPTSLTTLLLCQKLVTLARKQSNFLLADRLIQYLRDHIQSLKGTHADLLALNMQYEDILLKYAKGNHEEAMLDIWSYVGDSMLSVETVSSGTASYLKAKACLKLSTWLRQEAPNPNFRNVLLKICQELSFCSNWASSTGSRSNDGYLKNDIDYNELLEEIVGIARKMSCNLCPTLGKTWLSYASWCFYQAQGSSLAGGAVLQSYSLSRVLCQELSPERCKLSEGEMSKLEAIIRKVYDSEGDVEFTHDSDGDISKFTHHQELEALISSLVEQVVCLMQAAARAPGFESCNDECPSAALSSQLQLLFLSAKDGMSKHEILPMVNELVDIWWSLRQRSVSLYGYAAHGFFQYLSYSSKLLANSANDALQEKQKSCTLRALLYVLHIIVNYGYELSDTLELGLSTVPLLPWQEVIPQLFARLSFHPNQVVRKQLEGLVMMLAKLFPWSIVYPTLVDLNTDEGCQLEELRHIFDCLSKLYPKLVQDVQLVINELGMITILWEELWLSTLQDLHTDVIRRINMLKVEAARVAENSTLSDTEKNKINAAKYSAMMSPIVVALERRLTSTSREPRTSHELWFHQEYFEQLKSAILNFKTPPKSTTALGDVWRPFDTIAASLSAHQRKSCISLHELAPHLASLSSSDVPMPGFEKQISMLDTSRNTASDNQGIVTISTFGDQVTILSTKTKPKKLVLKGSDGQKYTYLLKGREDLRLDARIMQLLQATNGFLSSSDDICSHELAIRYYSVTPISGRAGLIQWVDNVTSIYSVFKSWQMHTQMAQASKGDAGNVNNLPPVPRPSDMFYGKIIPALKEKGIRRVISRRDWPLEVKRKVFLELMKETPRQLLFQEMWCASEGFKEFSSKTKSFSGSVAAMCMVGHVLGLGDRHLDNILMDFCTGDILHIDYNVCFDKGRRLKVPEIVPFRLTQTIEAALGLTGVEGIFRSNCEAVMRILRKNKDIILKLLEVFIWDPLVEWTRGDIHDEAAICGEEKKGMELAVSLSLFASRVQELRVPLQEHHDHLVSTLPTVESALKALLDMLNQYELSSASFYHADKEKLTLMQREVSAKSIAAEATSIYEKTRTSYEVQVHEFAQAKGMAAEKAQEAALWIDQHGRVLDALQSGSIPDAKGLPMLRGKGETLSLISAVVFSGVPLTIVPEPTQAQCYDLDKEVSRLIDELDNGLSCAIEALKEYALTLQKVLPSGYVTSSLVNGWAQVLQLSANSPSSDALLLARNQTAELIAKSNREGFDSVRQRHQDLLRRMELYALEIEKIAAESSVLTNSIGTDTEEKSKERLLSAFTKYMQTTGCRRNEDKLLTSPGQCKYDEPKSAKVHGDLEEKKMKVLSMLCMAVIELYQEIETNTINFSNIFTQRVLWRIGDSGSPADIGNSFIGFEEQIEKCVLVAGFVCEVQELVDVALPSASTIEEDRDVSSTQNWASIYQSCLHLTNQLLEQMTEFLLPEIIRSAVTHNSETMEAFGLLSQIRGSIDTALEKLVEVELERASLSELDKNYFVKVGLITEKQLSLGEAALNGRDHLSWEEAEEIASQEEACRTQLDQLHQAWNQKDTRSSSLKKLETSIINSLSASQEYFTTLINTDEEGDLHVRRSKALLAALVKPFAELEAVDHNLMSHGTFPVDSDGSTYNLANFMTPSSSMSESVWSYPFLLRHHAFFIWKVSIMDSILDMCFHDISSSVDNNVSFDQLYRTLKKKLEVHLQEHIGRYLNGRIAPAFLAQVNYEIKNLQHMMERREFAPFKTKDLGAVRKIRLMLEEYCNAHETARAARSAVSLMKRQVNELTVTLGETVLEIVQMEWLHDMTSPYLVNAKALSGNILGDDKFFPLVLDISRSKLLEKLQSSMSSVARSLEGLQACERTSTSAEVQLERAMAWACAGSTAVGTVTSTKTSGIPTDFHDHLMRRRQLLWAVQEQASEIIKICNSVMEFEASRDGLFWIPGEQTSGRTTADGRTWQQVYLNTLTRLDVSYHSFFRAEQEWKIAESNMEAAANTLLAATNEHCIATVKANTASDDLQNILVVMTERANEASAALSAFVSVSKGHTALTSECGSMLEEVLVITEGLEDVYILGKEAAAAHSAMMEDLSKANLILIPLEASFSTDLATLTAASCDDKGGNKEIPLVYGQALYQSYIHKLREACRALIPLVPSLINYVKELHYTLTKLARVSSMHAGNLHKALEGLGESQNLRSQNLAISSSDNVVLFKEKDKVLLDSNEKCVEGLTTNNELLHDDGWISPPDHTYTSSTESSTTLSGSSISYKSNHVEQYFHRNTAGEDTCTGIDGLERKFVEDRESRCLTEDRANSLSSLLPPDLGENGIEHVGSLYDVEKGKSDLTKALIGDNEHFSKPVDEHGENLDTSFFGVASRNTRGHVKLKRRGGANSKARPLGKNAYALTVLKQVECKIDGKDIDGIRSAEVSEQVDYLLKQATNIDNLCNMYEGWTPWI